MTTNTLTRCAVYARDRDGGTLARQVAEAERRAADEAWTVTHRYVAAGGTSHGEPGGLLLGALLSDMRRNAFDVVIATRVTRFARSAGDLSALWRASRDSGVALVTIDEPVDTRSEDTLASVLDAVAAAGGGQSAALNA